jgi:D-amino-acid dehydrogenase
VSVGAPRDLDVLVVGAGVVGICSAWYLRQAGFDVTVVDRGAVCSGASHGNAGLLCPSHSVPLAEPAALAHGLRWMVRADSPFYIKPRLDTDLWRWLWRFWRAATAERVERAIPLLRDLHLASRDLYAAFDADGLEFGYGHRGRLLVCESAPGLAAAIDEGQHMAAAGLPAEELDAEGVSRRLGGIDVTCAGGLFYPQDAHLDPARLVHALAARCRDAGVDILEQAEVLRLETTGRRVRSVETTRGTLRPRHVVIAAGSWSPELGDALGVRLPIQPAKGYSVEIDAPQSTPSLPFMLTEAKVAVTPFDDGRVRFAGTLELAGHDLSINRRRVDALIASVPRYLPGWDPATFRVREVWRGLRPCTPDGLPLLGRPRAWENVILATGHAMVGISLGAVTGQLVARLAAGHDPSRESGPDLSLLDPDRFA